MSVIQLKNGKTISYEIISQKEYNYKYFSTSGLTKDKNGKLKLKNYEYHFEVLVKNQDNEERVFKIIFNEDCESPHLNFEDDIELTYHHHRMNDQDESKELKKFCKNEVGLIDQLQNTAKIFSSIELLRLTTELKEKAKKYFYKKK